MSQETYLEEAHQRYSELMAQVMRRRMNRRLFMKASTLAAMGGAAAVNGLLAACVGKDTEELTKQLTEYQYSRYAAVEKYNWRRLPWGGTPYIDGQMVFYRGGYANYDTVDNTFGHGGQFWQLLTHARYGAGANMEQLSMDPDLADKLSHAPDYSYYDYHLRPDCYFQNFPPVNGRRVTAQDVLYSLETYRTRGVYIGTLEFVDRFEVLPDGETVRAYIKKPVNFADYIFGSANLWIFAREHYEGDKNRWRQQPIGSGPFGVVETQYRGALELVRNPGYGLRDDRWKGYTHPFLRGVSQPYISDTAAQKSAYRTNQIDFFNGSGAPTEFNDLLATNPESTIQVIVPNTEYSPHQWHLDNRKKPFSDVRVRRAMNMALDRQALADTAYGGFAAPGDDLSYNLLGRSDPKTWEEQGPWQQYNPQKAKELLNEAGYPNGFEMEFITTSPVRDDHLLTAKFLQDVGIRVRFNTTESAVVTEARLQRKYNDAIEGSDISSLTAIVPARHLYLPDSMLNRSWANDPIQTEMVEKATYTLDPDEQMRLLIQVNERALDQCYSLYRVVAFKWLFRHPWVHNGADAASGWFGNFGNWQWAVVWVDDTAPAERRGRLKA